MISRHESIGIKVRKETTMPRLFTQKHYEFFARKIAGGPVFSNPGRAKQFQDWLVAMFEQDSSAFDREKFIKKIAKLRALNQSV